MDFAKLTIFGVPTLAVFYVFWAAMHDIAHGHGLTLEYTALGVGLVVLLLLYCGAEVFLAAREKALWLAGTGLLVLLFDVAAVNATFHPKYPSDPAIAAGVLLAGIPLLVLLTTRMRATRARGGLGVAARGLFNRPSR